MTMILQREYLYKLIPEKGMHIKNKKTGRIYEGPVIIVKEETKENYEEVTEEEYQKYFEEQIHKNLDKYNVY